MNREEFEGDVLLVDSNDGGLLTIVNGLVMPDRGFTTAMYLSLFGGNFEDSGKVDNSQTWWGNRINETKENEKLISKFQSFIRGNPLTSKNLNLVPEYIEQDLAWMKEIGICDEIKVDVRATSMNQISIQIVIAKSGELIDKGNFNANWEAVNNGI